MFNFMVVLFLIFLGTVISIMPVPIYISPHPCQHLLLVVFLMIATLTDVHTIVKRCKDANGYCSIIYKSQDKETTCTHRLMNKENMINVIIYIMEY